MSCSACALSMTPTGNEHLVYSNNRDVRDSSVGTAILYGLDGPGIESMWRPDFPHPFNRPWGSSSLLCTGYWVSLTRVKRPGRGANHPPPSSAEVRERVELYLYSFFGPSWPVLGWALPLPFYCELLLLSVCYHWLRISGSSRLHLENLAVVYFKHLKELFFRNVQADPWVHPAYWIWPFSYGADFKKKWSCSSYSRLHLQERHHCTLSEASWIRFVPLTCFFQILFNIIFLSTSNLKVMT
jgi:hypothetical protein